MGNGMGENEPLTIYFGLPYKYYIMHSIASQLSIQAVF